MRSKDSMTTALSLFAARLLGRRTDRIALAASGPPAARSTRSAERGSALIISLMIMVILTMMGVTFLVLSEQENKISINSRDHAQALYLAEAAVNIGLTWFNDPGATNVFKPADNQMNLTLRKGRVFCEDCWDNDDERAADWDDTAAEVDGSAGNVYTGGTQGGAGASKFNKPFRGPFAYGFWGRRDTPDVLLCNSATLDVDGDGTLDCTAAMRAYMQRLNDALLMSTSLRTDGHKSNDFGVIEIEQIRVYRPPVDFNILTRYGIATIEAVAIKRVQGRIVARRSVREIIQEIPFPGPGGAIETDGTIEFSGSSGVHWGAVMSSSTADDIDIGSTGNANFVDASVARQTSARFGFHWTINPAARDDLDGNAGNNRVSTWLTDALGITMNSLAGDYCPPAIGDPWLVFRARRNVIASGWTIPNTAQPFNYSAAAGGNGADAPGRAVAGNNCASRLFDKSRKANGSHIFQKQIIRFPPIDYDTWKAIAQTGQRGMYYFKWDAGQNYKQDGIGTARAWTWWLNNYKTGVFFFDTMDSTRPRADGSNLTPSHPWTPGLYIEGFIYVNSVAFDSTGAGTAPRRELNMPGEPFLDDGIDLHASGDTVGNDCICLRYDAEDGCVLGARPIGHVVGTSTCAPALKDGDDCTCVPGVLATMNDAASYREAQTFRNGIWDSDIDNDGVTDASTDITQNSGWNRFIGDNNGGTDGGYSQGHGYAAGILPGYPPGRRFQQGLLFQAAGDWRRDPRFLNHITDLDGTNAQRQPHEPFLNFNSNTNGATVADWAGGDHGLRLDYTARDEAVEKAANGTVLRATTRARDATGALYGLEPHVNGVVFFEGEYTGAGNIKVYGSMLMKGGYGSTGSLEVWFNEDLVKGNFPPPKWKLPRVFSTARDTE